MQLFLIWLLCTFGVPFLTCIWEVLHKLFTCSDMEEEKEESYQEDCDNEKEKAIDY